MSQAKLHRKIWNGEKLCRTLRNGEWISQGLRAPETR